MCVCGIIDSFDCFCVVVIASFIVTWQKKKKTPTEFRMQLHPHLNIYEHGSGQVKNSKEFDSLLFQERNRSVGRADLIPASIARVIFFLIWYFILSRDGVLSRFFHSDILFCHEMACYPTFFQSASITTKPKALDAWHFVSENNSGFCFPLLINADLTIPCTRYKSHVALVCIWLYLNKMNWTNFN